MATQRAYVVLAIGVTIVSSASILIRYAQATGMAELAIAAYRLLFAGLLLAPFAAQGAFRTLRHLSARQCGLIVVAGIFLALHFATWIVSLAYTSVASSVALVTSHPLWVALAAFLFLGERPGWLSLAGIGATMIGAAAIFSSDQAAGIGTQPLLGNALAVLGAISIAAYILAARAMRDAVATWQYVWIVYSLAALLLAGAALVSGQLLVAINMTGLGFVLLMALGPQLFGHTAINYAARHLRPTMVSVAILGEPVLSAAAAWLLLGEQIVPLQLAGFACTVTGIVLCALDDRANWGAANKPS